MKQEPGGQSRSIRQSAEEAARRVTRPLSSASDMLTGRAVEQQVAEFSETFTQVALGLHDDLTAANRRMVDLERTVAELKAGPPGIESRLLLLSIAAVVMSLAAVGVALWAAL